MSAPQTTPPEAAEPAETTPQQPSRMERYLHEVLTSSWLLILAAIVLALALAALLIAAADPDVQAAAGYFFARPTDLLGAAWDAVAGAYSALFRGAIFDPNASSTARMIKPITDTLTSATPLIFAGLGLGVGFRAGMFNIGAQGQVLMGATWAAFVGFTWQLPSVLHVVLAALAGAVAGGLWAGIAGFLKARTGANEVIVTIMLNNIAGFLMAYLLTTTLFKRPGGNNPISPMLPDSAMFSRLLPEPFRLHSGFLLALAAAAGVWWLMERSTIGFRFRAVGANASAARTAGISVDSAFIWVMVTAGALAGMGGVSQVLGTEGVLQDGVGGSIGFDAITVALLGRSRPLGTVFAALVFGALRAGSPLMQTVAGTPIDVVLVVQALIVLLIAAPPLVRMVFRLPTPGVPAVRELGAKEVSA